MAKHEMAVASILYYLITGKWDGVGNEISRVVLDDRAE
jgi:hypothetical protein